VILLDGEKSTRMYRKFDDYLATAGKSATRGAKSRLVVEARKAAIAYRDGSGEAGALAEVSDAKWTDYLDAVWRAVVPHAGKLTVEMLGGEADAGAFDRIARLYVDRNAAGRGAGIANTSRNAIAGWIAEGLEEFETNSEIARRIIAESEKAAEWRSATIGLTESHAAGYLGAWSGALQTLRGWVKIWAAPRARGITCDQHKSAHGQRRGLREAFHVANDYEISVDPTRDEMAYPGDGERGARASNVINCRCDMELRRP